jgi:hypothetical protein
MNDTSPGRSAALFLQLVLGLQQSGMMTLGKLMNPISRRIETNLDAARDTIDTLAAIEARTRGNLESDEARVLKQVLTDLRMNYIDAVKKSGRSEKAAALADEPAPPPTQQPDGDPGPAGEIATG